MEVIIAIGFIVVALLFAEASSMSLGADSRDPIGDDHARPITWN
jgi:hypothetical protein